MTRKAALIAAALAALTGAGMAIAKPAFVESASVTVGERARPSSAGRVDPAASALMIPRLHGLHRSVAALQPLARDPFVFKAPVTPAARPKASAVRPEAGQAVASVVATMPAMTLIGIAEDSTAGDLIRTAIIASPAGLWLVREGEDVTGSYRVTRISGDAAELTDDSGATHRLEMK